MAVSQSEPLGAIAASRVLRRILGPQMYNVTKYHLNSKYHIGLDEGSQIRFNLQELRAALYELFGDGGASLIISKIDAELDKLQSK